MNVAPSDSAEGEYSVSAEFDLDAEAYCRTTAALCADAYSTEYETENEYSEREISDMLLFGSKKIDLSGESPLRSEDAKVIDVSFASSQSSLSTTDGVISCVCTVKIKTLLSDGGDITAQETELPVRAELSALPEGVLPQEVEGSVSCSVSDVSSFASGDTLKVSCALTLSYSVWRRRKVRYVSAIKLEEKSQARPTCIKVYYPEHDESVWEIGRRYRADRTRLLKNNSFDGDVALKGRPVIIM